MKSNVLACKIERAPPGALSDVHLMDCVMRQMVLRIISPQAVHAHKVGSKNIQGAHSRQLRAWCRCRNQASWNLRETHDQA